MTDSGLPNFNITQAILGTMLVGGSITRQELMAENGLEIGDLRRVHRMDCFTPSHPTGNNQQILLTRNSYPGRHICPDCEEKNACVLLDIFRSEPNRARVEAAIKGRRVLVRVER